MSWWACPNTPPCPHAGVVHDVYDFDDPTPTVLHRGLRLRPGNDPEPIGETPDA